MKTRIQPEGRQFLSAALLLMMVFAAPALLRGQTVIGGTTPNPAAALDIQSTDKGFLPPRMTSAQRDAIPNPPAGLIIFNTTLNSIELNVGAPAAPDWRCLSFELSAGDAAVLNEILEDSNSPGGANNANGIPVSLLQLQALPLTGVISAYIGAYQQAINAETGFSNPPTVPQVQVLINAVNAAINAVLAQIGNEGDSPDNVNSVVTVAQLQSLPVTGVNPAYETAYQDYIDANPNSFSSPATVAEVQVLINAVNNAVDAVLTQIGNEGDDPDVTNSVVTIAQLQSLPVTGVNPAYETAYQDYIDANPGLFSSPATIAEVQAAITAVNAAVPTSGGTALVSAYSCTTASDGSLLQGQAATGVTQTITATVTTVGTYNITATANGITFSGSGTFAGTGSQNIVLTATGTPAAAGTNSFTLSTTPGCSFDRTTAPVATLTTLSFNNLTGVTGRAMPGAALNGVSTTLSYTGGNGGGYNAQTVSSTGIEGLTLNIAAGTVATGNGSFSFTVTGTPSTTGGSPTGTGNGLALFTVTLGGQTATVRVPVGCGAYTTTANTWQVFACHNLGANTAADPFTYAAGNADGSGGTLGHLYQWGRPADGHQLRNSATTTTLATSNTPGNSSFILNGSTFPYDWLSGGGENARWGDGTTNANPAKAANDPCPAGWKIPSQSQWGSIFRGGTTSGAPGTATANTWTWTGNGFTVGSSLYLPAAGVRSRSNGSRNNVGTYGYYWSSTVSSSNAFVLDFTSGNVLPGNAGIRALGFSVRCVPE